MRTSKALDCRRLSSLPLTYLDCVTSLPGMSLIWTSGGSKDHGAASRGDLEIASIIQSYRRDWYEVRISTDQEQVLTRFGIRHQ